MESDTRSIGRWKLLERIDEGVTGELWRIEDSSEGKDGYVAKLSPQSGVHDAEHTRSYFGTMRRLREVELPPRWIMPEAFGEDLGAAYMVRQYVHGRSVADFVPGGQGSPLPVAASIDLCRKLLYDLDAIHQLGVLHGGLTPSNIILDENGDSWVLDLGWGRYWTSTQAGPPETTVEAPKKLDRARYLPPEQQSPETFTPHGDLYSVGVLLQDLIQAAGGAGDLADPIEEIVNRSMALPEENFAAAREMADQLERLPLTPSEGSDRGSQRPMWPVAAGIGVILTILVALVVVVYPRLNGSDPARTAGVENSDSHSTKPPDPPPTVIPKIGPVSGELSRIIVGAEMDGFGSLLQVTDDGSTRPLVKAGTNARSPRWSPDGRQVAFVSYRTRRQWIGLVDVAANQVKWIEHPPGDARLPSWSPDSRRLAFLGEDADGTRIRILDPATGQIEILPNVRPGRESVSWSPDGEELVFSVPGGGIRIVSPGGGTPRKLSGIPAGAHAPAWAPGGDQIACLQEGARASVMLLVRPEGGLSHSLLLPGRAFGTPLWGPDGSTLLIRVDRGAESRICTVTTGAAPEVRIVSADETSAWAPAWWDATHVAFLVRRGVKTELLAAGVAGGAVETLAHFDTFVTAVSSHPSR